MEQKMEQSNEINELAKALSAFQGECTSIAFNSNVSYELKKGGTKDFKYADLNQLWTHIRPLLPKHGLSVVQPMGRASDGEPVITTQLNHSSGQWIRSSAFYGASGTPQDQGSYITYMKRYGLAAMLGLVSEEDDDGQAGANGDAKAKEKKAAAPSEPAVAKTSDGMNFMGFMDQLKNITSPADLQKLYDGFAVQASLTVGQKTAAKNAYETKMKALEKAVQ